MVPEQSLLYYSSKCPANVPDKKGADNYRTDTLNIT